jgi:aryl-alcohol dehydrogenase-like predicted oxidoreductase
MQYRRLGRTNFMAAEVGIGLSRLASLKADAGADVVRAAVAAGMNIVEVDTRSDSEIAVLASMLRGLRPQLIVVGVGDGVRPGTQAALTALGLDHFDCYLAADTGDLGEVQALGLAGLTRAVGLTTSEPASALAAVLDGSIEVLQLSFNPLELRDPSGADALLTAARGADVGVLACSPLARGVLGHDAQLLDTLAFLTDGPARSVAQAAIAWALSDLRVGAVVGGPRTVEQARENAEASRIAPLPDDILERIADALRGG